MFKHEFESWVVKLVDMSSMNQIRVQELIMLLM